MHTLEKSHTVLMELVTHPTLPWTCSIGNMLFHMHMSSVVYRDPKNWESTGKETTTKPHKHDTRTQVNVPTMYTLYTQKSVNNNSAMHPQNALQLAALYRGNMGRPTRAMRYSLCQKPMPPTKERTILLRSTQAQTIPTYLLGRALRKYRLNFRSAPADQKPHPCLDEGELGNCTHWGVDVVVREAQRHFLGGRRGPRPEQCPRHEAVGRHG
jgi:hypothetical protein